MASRTGRVPPRPVCAGRTPTDWTAFLAYGGPQRAEEFLRPSPRQETAAYRWCSQGDSLQRYHPGPPEISPN